MKTREFLSFTALGTLLGFLIGCQGVGPGPQQLAYMQGIGMQPASMVPLPPRGPQGPVDTVSYWEGDGVPGSPRVEIRLAEQKAYFYKGGDLVGVSLISSGDAKHRTPPGSFKISQKSRDHRSSLYGDFVDEFGNVIIKDVDSRKDKAPAGLRYQGASMKYFMRFNHGIGMHAGFLPGYPASHGCIRMPEHMARSFFENVRIGTPVKVIR